MSDFRRIVSPPSNISGALGDYLREVARAINDIPNFSVFSGTSPNSLVTGYPGDWAIKLTSSSTDSRAWLKGGASRTASTTGWVVIRIAS